MINPRELRIGNYLKDKISGEWMIVDEIGENVGAIIIDRSKYPLQPGWEMDYILLTPEVLQKCGFGKGHVTLFDKGLKLNFFDGRAYIGNLTSTSATHVEGIKYIHQLQNLYFALTGDELPISL